MDFLTLLACIGIFGACGACDSVSRRTSGQDPDPWTTSSSSPNNTPDLSPLTNRELVELREALEAIATLNTSSIPARWDESRDDFHDPLWQWARLDDTKQDVAQQRETSNTYAELGPLYASASPVASSVGAELGIVTRDTQANTVQRTGVGFYLRSDHLLNKRWDTTVPRA